MKKKTVSNMYKDQRFEFNKFVLVYAVVPLKEEPSLPLPIDIALISFLDRIFLVYSSAAC